VGSGQKIRRKNNKREIQLPRGFIFFGSREKQAIRAGPDWPVFGIRYIKRPLT